MKIRLDFVTNSSSSSFVAYGIYDEELAKNVRDLIKKYDAKHRSSIGWISVSDNVVSVTRKLEDIAECGYYIFSLLEDDNDGRNRRQIVADEKKALTVENVMNALIGFFDGTFPNNKIKLLISTALKEKGVKCRVYADQTDGFCPEDFSDESSELKFNRMSKNSPNGDEFIVEKGVLKKYKGKQTFVVIPDNVTSIGEEAFKGCKKITSITIGKSVTSIGKYAFYECTSLSNIILPDTIKRIGVGTFKGCSSIASIKIPAAVKSISAETFKHCTALKEVILHDSLTGIGAGAFCDTMLQNITLPSSLTQISDMVFSGSMLKSIEIPALVDYISDGVFSGCQLLENIYVSENNSVYKSIDGNLYFKDGSTLVKYCAGKKDSSFVVPESVKTIGSRVFSNCTRLKNIDIPVTVQRFGEYAFIGCESLTIRTENEQQPSTWHNDWNLLDFGGKRCPVVWGYKK